MKKLISTIGAMGLLMVGLATPAHAHETHVIEGGDTFWMLSKEKDIPLGDILKLNPDEDVMNLEIGSTVILPPEADTVAPTKKQVDRQSAPKVERQAKPRESGVWDHIAQCESGGDWSINTGNNYFGGIQFSKTSWDAMGGQEFAEYPHHASKAEQIIVAEKLQDVQGWGAWPVCSKKIGLR